MSKQNRWRELYEQRQQEIRAAAAAAARRDVAGRKGLPSDLADRLQGETPEELERDADALLALYRPAPPSAGPVDMSALTPAEIRAARAAGKIRF